MAATEPTLPAIRLAREFGRGDMYAERVDRVTGLPELIAACEAYFTEGPLSASFGHCRLYEQLGDALEIAREGRQ